MQMPRQGVRSAPAALACRSTSVEIRPPGRQLADRFVTLHNDNKPNQPTNQYTSIVDSSHSIPSASPAAGTTAMFAPTALTAPLERSKGGLKMLRWSEKVDSKQTEGSSNFRDSQEPTTTRGAHVPRQPTTPPLAPWALASAPSHGSKWFYRSTYE